MDLIVNVIAVVISFIASVIGNILAHDICATVDARCAKIIGRAAARLDALDREDMKQEWLADLSERDSVRAKYQHAVGCFLAAPRMRRRAQTLEIEVKFKISSVGTVPVTVSVDPLIGMTILNHMGGGVRRPVTFVVIIYQLSKILVAAHKLGPGRLGRFVEEMKNFKKWDFEVNVRRKGWDLDFSKLAKLWILDKEQGNLVLQQLNEVLGRKRTDCPQSISSPRVSSRPGEP